jgi:hypothetical protein
MRKIKTWIGLAALLLAGMTTVPAQSEFNIMPLGLGTVTNQVVYTNYYSLSGVWTTNFVTNTIITPNYSPTVVSNSSSYVQWGASSSAWSGYPGWYLNNSLASGAGPTIVNGWMPIPPNVDLYQAVIVNESQALATGSLTFGYDFSDDAVYGSTNTPLTVAVTLTAGLTNEYFSTIDRTNFQKARYFRWDSLVTPGTVGVTIVSNKFDWRGAKITF